MMRACALLLGVLLFGLPAWAVEQGSFNDFWNRATQCVGTTEKDYPDFTMVVCDRGLTHYYFTKPNHPAFPGVIKRSLTRRGGSWFVREEGHSYASVAAQPAFSAWLAQFDELDRQMKGDIARRRSDAPPSLN